MARKEKTIHYIYKTVCNVTGRYYVGMHSTSNLDDGYMGSGLRLRRSLRKYGPENHTKEILEYLPTREALVLREIEIVTKELIGEDLCMNLKEGGTGGWVSPEVQLKCSRAGGKASGEKNKTDINHKLLTLSKLKKGLEKLVELGPDYLKGKGKGRVHSDESKEKISLAIKNKYVGETNSQYGTCWITKDGANKKIKKEDLEIYLEEGWVKGRIIKYENKRIN